MNKNFGTLSEGAIVYAPNPIIGAEGEQIFTTNPCLYGYKRIVHTAPPSQDGFCPILSYIETESEITEVWTLEPLPEQPLSDSERIAELEEALRLLAGGETV